MNNPTQTYHVLFGRHFKFGFYRAKLLFCYELLGGDGVGGGDAFTSTGSKRGETWRLCPTVKTGRTVRMKRRWRERLCSWTL